MRTVYILCGIVLLSAILGPRRAQIEAFALDCQASPTNNPAQDFIRKLRQEAFCDANALIIVSSDLQGWMWDGFEALVADMLSQLHSKLQRPLVVIEVGSWKGLSTHTIAKVAKKANIPVDIIAVDTWLGAPEFWTWGMNDPTRGGSLRRKAGYPLVYYLFLKNMLDNGHQDVISPLPLPSAQAYDVLRHYNIVGDMIYIDGAHEYDAVKQDISNYWNILQSGGIMLGDDYVDGWPGVKKAVDELSAEKGVSKKVHGVVWVLEKN